MNEVKVAAAKLTLVTPRVVQMALATFAILALEPRLCRWVRSPARLAAYFANLILLATFFGMGLGVALGSRFPTLLRWCLPTLAVLSVLLAYSEQIGFMGARFPDTALYTWTAG